MKAELWSSKPAVSGPLRSSGPFTAGPAGVAAATGEGTGEAAWLGFADGEAPGLAAGLADGELAAAGDAAGAFVGPLAAGVPQPTISSTVVTSIAVVVTIVKRALKKERIGNSFCPLSTARVTQ